MNSRLGTRQLCGIYARNIDYTHTIEPIAKHERELFGRTLRVFITSYPGCMGHVVTIVPIIIIIVLLLGATIPTY